MAFTYREGLGRPLSWQEMDGNLEHVEELAGEAEQSASAASGSAEAAEEQAGIATTKAGEAGDHEQQAQIYAAAAQSAAGIPALAGNARKVLGVKSDETGVEFIGPDSALVGEDDNQTLTNKTIEDGILTGITFQNGAVRIKLSSVTTSIDCSSGNYFWASRSSNTTFSFSNVPNAAYAFTLRLTLTGAVTVAWPAEVRWPKDIAPALGVGTHLITFVKDTSASVWRGVANVGYSS